MSGKNLLGARSWKLGKLWSAPFPAEKKLLALFFEEQCIPFFFLANGQSVQEGSTVSWWEGIKTVEKSNFWPNAPIPLGGWCRGQMAPQTDKFRGLDLFFFSPPLSNFPKKLAARACNVAAQHRFSGSGSCYRVCNPAQFCTFETSDWKQQRQNVRLFFLTLDPVQNIVCQRCFLENAINIVSILIC